MPNNPLTPQELLTYLQASAQNGINPPALPFGYVYATPPTTDGGIALRKFDAAYISTGIIDPNRLGTGATGAGNLYLADDGQWKPVAGGGGGGDMYKATYDTDNSGIVDKAEALMTLGRNSTGDVLRKGTVIRIEGSTGNRPNFVKALGNNDANSAQTFGVIATDINNNSDGYAIVQGTLHDLDTRTGANGALYPFTDVTLADGDLLFLHPTIPGYITNIKPSAPQHLVYVGVVTRTSPTNGTIVYRIQNGYELYELHDVAPTPYINNGVLYRDTTTNLWKSATIPTLLGGTPLLTVPTLDQVTTAGNTTTNAITVGKVTTNGSITATAALAQGVAFNNTLVAAANNDILVGLDINPTFTNGAFTNVQNFGLRIQGNTSSSNPSLYIKQAADNFPTWLAVRNRDNLSSAGSISADLGISGGTNQFFSGTVQGDVVFKAFSNSNSSRFFIGATNNVTPHIVLFPSTGNMTIASSTDTGHKLRVNGTVSANLTAGSQANAVYYNTTTGELTYATAGGGGSTPTLQQVTTAGNITTNAVRVEIASGDGLFLKAATSGVSYPLIMAADSAGRGFVIGSSALTFTSRATYGVQFNVRSNYSEIQAYTNISIGTPYPFIINPTGGDVLIGTTTLAGYKLDVNGTQRIGSSSTTPFGSPLLFMGKDQNLETNFQISNSTSGTSATVGFRIFAANGRSSQIFEFSGSHSLSEFAGHMVFEPNSPGIKHGLIFSIPETVSGSDFMIYSGGRTASNRKLTLFNNGNLLLQSGGTHTDAGYKLDVNGGNFNNAFRVTGYARFTGATNTTGVYIDNGLQIGSTIFLGQYTFAPYMNITSSSVSTNWGTVAFNTNNINAGDPSILLVSSPTNKGFTLGSAITGGGANAWATMKYFFDDGSMVLQYSASSIDRVASSLLTLNSTIKGFLQPRMTNTEAVAISTPATGLQVYDTTNNKNLLYNGSVWQNIATESWVTAQGYLTSVATPTFAQVTSAGNTTTNSITVGGLIVDTNTLVVDSTNNRVGVGTATPTSTMDILGTFRATTGAYATNSGITVTSDGEVVVGGTTPRPGGRILTVDGLAAFNYTVEMYGELRFGQATGDEATVYTIKSGGALQIHANMQSSNATFDTLSLISGASNSSSIVVLGNFSDGRITFNVFGSESMRISKNGNLLLGKTNDEGYKLDVTGTIRSSSIIYATGGNSTNWNTAFGWGNHASAGYLTTQPWVTSGSDIYYTTGNVGIGTSTPTEKLHIVDGAAANIFARISATSANATAAWVAQNDQTDNIVYRVFGSTVSGSQLGQTLPRSASLLANLGGSGAFLVGTFSSTNLILGTSNAERMRIFANGNITINSTTDAGYRLDVNGSLRTFNLFYVQGGSANWNETTPGTSVGSIHLNPGNTTDNYGNAITFGASDYSDGNNGQAGIYVRSDGTYGTKMYFATTDAYVSGSKTRMMIDHTGKVGIATSSPGYTLDVNGNFNSGPASIGVGSASFDTQSNNRALTLRGDLVVGGTGLASAKIVLGAINSTKYLEIGSDGTGPYFYGTTVLDLRFTTYTGGLYVTTNYYAYFTNNLAVGGNANAGSRTLVVNGTFGTTGVASIGTLTNPVRFLVGAKVVDDNNYTYDTNTAMVVHQTATATATLNDPKEVLILARQGTAGQAFGAAAALELSRYENSGVASRTRLDFKLADGSFLSASTRVMTMLSNGNVGIGTTSPEARLHTNGNILVKNTDGFPRVMIRGNYPGLLFSSDDNTMQFGSITTIQEYASNPYGNLAITSRTGLYIYIQSFSGSVPAMSFLGGNVQVGNNADAGYKFDVAGSLRSTGSAYFATTSGSVGIGTITPNAPLGINGTGGDNTPLVRYSGSSSATFNWLTSGLHPNLIGGQNSIHIFGKANSQYNSAWVGYLHSSDGSSNNALSFGMYGANNLMNITGLGNVGIGTTAPSSPAGFAKMVELYGSSSVSYVLNSNNTDKMDMGISSSGGYLGVSNNNALRFATNNAERMRITGGGFVGIGTTSPSAQLTISTPNGYDGTILQLQSRSEPNNYHLKVNEVVTDGVVGWSFDVYNQGAYNNMLVFDRAKLGIGTSNPSVKVHIGARIIHESGYVHDANALQIAHQTGTGSSVLNDPKEVLILSRQGTGYQSTGAGAAFEISRYEHTATLDARTRLDIKLAHGDYFNQSTRVMTMLSSGNIGIGTTAPAYILDVNGGDINVSGAYRVGGTIGYTGVITIPANPPGMQNIQVNGGIITGVF